MDDGDEGPTRRTRTRPQPVKFKAKPVRLLRSLRLADGTPVRAVDSALNAYYPESELHRSNLENDDDLSNMRRRLLDADSRDDTHTASDDFHDSRGLSLVSR